MSNITALRQAFRHLTRQQPGQLIRGVTSADRAAFSSLASENEYASDAYGSDADIGDWTVDDVKNMGPGFFGYPQQEPRYQRVSKEDGRPRDAKTWSPKRRPRGGSRRRYKHEQRVLTELRDRANAPGVKFREVAAALIYRAPAIMRKPYPIEVKYDAIQRKWQESYQHELSELMYYGSNVGDLNKPEAQMTQVEAKLAYQERMLREGPSPVGRKTAADRSGDIRDPGRELDDYLFFVIKKDRSEHAWQFPQGECEEGEAMYAAAKRETKEECGRNMQIAFARSLPLGHYVYHHDADRNGNTGTKVFFYRGLWLTGEPKLAEKEGIVDFAWLNRTALKEYFSEDYYAFVEPMLPRRTNPGDQQ